MEYYIQIRLRFPTKSACSFPHRNKTVRLAEFFKREAPGSGERAAAARVRFPPPTGCGLSAPLPPPRLPAAPRLGRPGRGFPGPRRRPLQAAAGNAGGRNPSPSATVSEPEPQPPPAHRGAPSPSRTHSSPPAASQRPPEPPRRPLTPKRPGPSPPRPSARPLRPAPAFTLERPRQPQQGRRRRIEELSRSSRERLLQSRDKMFSKFTSILQHAVEAVRPRAAGSRQAGDGGGLRSLRPRPGPQRPGSRGGARPGRARLGRRGAGASGQVRSRPPSSPSCPRPARVPVRPREGGRGCPGRTGAPGRRGGRLTPGCGRGVGSTWRRCRLHPRTVNLLRKKVVSMEQDKRNGQTWLGLGFWLGVVLTLEGGVGRKVCPCWGGGGLWEEAAR